MCSVIPHIKRIFTRYKWDGREGGVNMEWIRQKPKYCVLPNQKWHCSGASNFWKVSIIYDFIFIEYLFSGKPSDNISKISRIWDIQKIDMCIVYIEKSQMIQIQNGSPDNSFFLLPDPTYNFQQEEQMNERQQMLKL